jgi:hypothetical protein
MNKEQLIERATFLLRVLAPEDKWPVDFKIIERLLEQVLTDYHDDIDGRLTALIKDWESRMDDDKTLYSLGVRRAQDIVRGIES